jgi:hypothetical protein
MATTTLWVGSGLSACKIGFVAVVVARKRGGGAGEGLGKGGRLREGGR